MHLRRRLFWLLILLVPPGAVGAWVAADWWFCLPDGEVAAYVGRERCAACHQKEVDAWTGSDHDRAMDLATPETVLGDFDNRQYTEFALEDLAKLPGGELRAVAAEVRAGPWALVLRGAGREFRQQVLSSLPESARAEVIEAEKAPFPVRPCDVVTARQEIGDVARRLQAAGRIKLPFGVTSTMFRRGDEFFVTTDGPTGKLETFRVKYVFGFRPLQQYLVEFPDGIELADGARMPKGSIQCLRLSWDTERKRWFGQYPGEQVPAGDELHWTGRLQNWNYMCADCHSTDLRKNYDQAAHAYRTTFSEIDVSCETCHGPGSLHVEIAESKRFFWDRRYRYGLPSLKDPDPRVEIENCAPCHSRRRIVSPDCPAEEQFQQRSGKYLDHYAHELFDQQSPLLADRALYYADGQILEEDYEYGSFIQSKMYEKGVRCTNCHDPHAVRVKVADPTDNQLCTGCHSGAHPSGKYDTATHHHHTDASKPGTRCVECHMPETRYMVVDPRRDHSLRVPRPDLTVSLGIPNACNGCHHDLSKGETPQWAADKVRQWYERREPDRHFAHAIAAGRAQQPGGEEALVALLRRRDTSAMVRASALLLLADYRSGNSRAAARGALEDPEALVRMTAVSALADLRGPNLADLLAPMLRDPVRAVRTEAARGLSQVPIGELPPEDRDAFREALGQYMLGQESLADQPFAHVNMALVYDNQGRTDLAQAQYETAVRLDPRSLPARNNLGRLYADQAAAAEKRVPLLVKAGRDEEAAELEQQIRRQRAMAEEQFLAAIGAHPGFVEVRDNLARLYYVEGKTAEAETQFRKIIELQPRLAEARYSVGLMLAEDPNRLADAAKYLAEAARLAPAEARVRYNFGLALLKLGRAKEAEQELTAARSLAPNEPDYVFALADLYLGQERWTEALECAQRLVFLRPEVPQFRAMLEQCRAKAAPRRPGTP
jgi:predicted CXXCH cytochrome family protein